MRPVARGHGAQHDAAAAGEGAPPIRSPLKFFLLVFALSIPFFLAGGITDLQLMPGLSVSALAAFCPMAAAWIWFIGRAELPGCPSCWQGPSTSGAFKRSAGTSRSCA